MIYRTHSANFITAKLLSLKLYRVSIVVFLVGALTACAGPSQSPTPGSSAAINNDSFRWDNSGSIVLARPIPGFGATDGGQFGVGTTPLLGFMPVQFAVAGEWLSIDRSKGTVTLMSGAVERQAASGEGISNLTPGVYSLLHKQRNPLWYAPDTYFQLRGLQTPAQGDRERYRRGALGDFALFIGQDLPLHSGPMWTSEIGGVRLADTDISRLYYQLDVGSVVEIK
mgnify:CR=1 FL=1